MALPVKLEYPERSRVYVYESCAELIVENVTHFAASESGTHYLNTADGLKYIVAPGWIYIKIDTDEWSV